MSPDREISRRDLLAALGLAGASAVVVDPNRFSGLRQRLLSTSDPVARRLGTYTAYRLDRAEFVGTLQRDRGTFDLRDLGYEHNPLSAAKYHPETDELDDSSWRRVDPDDPRWQWHVHLWENDVEVEAFSHYEYRPDPRLLSGESPSDMTQRLRDHYNPKWDTDYDADEANYFLGDACGELRAVVEDDG